MGSPGVERRADDVPFDRRGGACADHTDGPPLLWEITVRGESEDWRGGEVRCRDEQSDDEHARDAMVMAGGYGEAGRCGKEHSGERLDACVRDGAQADTALWNFGVRRQGMVLVTMAQAAASVMV
jgi:hypothetical protein